MHLFIISIALILFIQTSALPVISEPPKEISTNESGSPLVDPNVQKKTGSIAVPLAAETMNYRRGPMTRKAVYDPIKNITHIWDMRRGSYDLPGDHTKSRNKWIRRRNQEDDYE